MLTKKTTAKPKPKPKQDPAAAAPFSPQGTLRRAKPEPELPGPRIIRRKEVLRMLGIGRTALDELIARGDFPKPIKITGKRANGWFLDEVLDYMARLRATRDAASAREVVAAGSSKAESPGHPSAVGIVAETDSQQQVSKNGPAG